MTEDEMVGWHHRLNGGEFEQTLGDSEGQGSLMCCSPWGCKITADGDCRHEIKRHLLLGRKVMTNLDSMLKIRDITLPTNVHLVKAMVFPVVMYGCESWTIRRLSAKELMLSNCDAGENS